jgi:predicted nucleotidyltransferase
MSEIAKLLQEKREDILHIARKRKAYNVRIFGSAARGEVGPDSDVDILVDLEPGCNLFDYSGLKQDLEDLLGRKVDVVAEEGLHELIRDRVLEQAIPL